MRPASGHAILAGNHDLHLHSLYSDGWHTVPEVAGFALRWLEAERWVGVSDHSPFLPEVLQSLPVDALPADRAGVMEQIMHSSPAGLREVQKAIDAGTRAYITAAREDRGRVLDRHGARLLVGLEVEWHLGGPAVSVELLDELDYVLAGYHGRRLASPAEAEDFLRRVIHHPTTDVIAHPNCFLGLFDVRRCDWEGLFQDMAGAPVLCEYNLMTPLPDDLLALALDEPNLHFVIGSDTHDFRRRCQIRVMSAWAESEAGRFTTARDFLDGFLAFPLPDEGTLRALYDSPTELAELEARLWARTRRVKPLSVPTLSCEDWLLEQLDAETSDTRDREFLAARLHRFSAIPPRRIASLLSEKEFRSLVRHNRAIRRDRRQA